MPPLLWGFASSLWCFLACRSSPPNFLFTRFSPSSSLSLLLSLLCVYTSMHAAAHEWRSENNFQESFLSLRPGLGIKPTSSGFSRKPSNLLSIKVEAFKELPHRSSTLLSTMASSVYVPISCARCSPYSTPLLISICASN